MTGIKTVTRTMLVSTLIIHVQIERSGFFSMFFPSMGHGEKHCHWMRCDTLCSGITEYCCREDSGTGIASCHVCERGYSQIFSLYFMDMYTRLRAVYRGYLG